MNNKLSKISSFVDSLERNQLSENQQITLTVNHDDFIGGNVMNNKKCTNGAVGACTSSSNYKKCTNGNLACRSSENGKRCTNANLSCIDSINDKRCNE